MIEYNSLLKDLRDIIFNVTMGCRFWIKRYIHFWYIEKDAVSGLYIYCEGVILMPARSRLTWPGGILAVRQSAMRRENWTLHRRGRNGNKALIITISRYQTQFIFTSEFPMARDLTYAFIAGPSNRRLRNGVGMQFGDFWRKVAKLLQTSFVEWFHTNTTCKYVCWCRINIANETHFILPKLKQQKEEIFSHVLISQAFQGIYVRGNRQWVSKQQLRVRMFELSMNNCWVMFNFLFHLRPTLFCFRRSIDYFLACNYLRTIWNCLNKFLSLQR